MIGHSILDENGKVSVYKLAENLDDEQVEAVMAEKGNVLVRANAGAGKTRVLTSRVAYLVANGVPEDSIMLMTFTNKASREMLERVTDLLGGKKVQVLGGTFHRIGGMFLRRYADRLGYKRNFTILDPDDARSMIDKILVEYLKEQELKKKQFPDKKVILSFHSGAINKNKPVDEINREERNFPPSILDGIKKIISKYSEYKKQTNAMDFDDIIVNFKDLLEIDDIRREITKKYQYILVDEYQDINFVQHRIIEGLNKGNQNLFVVGDANQAIYSWRGSDVKYIETFEHKHLASSSYYITRNYRSDGAILKLAEYSINRGFNMKSETKITPFLPSENKPTLCELYDDYAQANWIVTRIEGYRKMGIPYKEMALLLRTNYLTRILEKEFRRHRIPYKLLAGYSYFERAHVKDVLAFLRFRENPKDKIAFIRITKLFDGIGDKTAEKLFSAFEDSGYDISSVLSVKVSKNAKDGVSTMVSILKEIQEKTRITAMLSAVSRGYYEDYLKNTKEDYKERMKDLEYLFQTATTYASLSDFLSEMMLDEPSDNEDDDNVVSISTVHRAKGLEWDCVFLPYMNYSVFPLTGSETVEEADEERRLFYVAVTRAKRHLNMSYIRVQSHTGSLMAPSVYVDELAPALFRLMKP